MSYLDNLRMAFAGTFQSDVSTVNNDVRHYDNKTFEARFQAFQQGPVWNGWWNPVGSGAFRLINCTVQGVHYQDGSGTTDAAVDPAVGLPIAGSDNRVGGKLVDLDPQWQMSSQIWGLEMRLTDGKAASMFEGHFEPAAFRDILFGRQEGNAAGDQTAAAAFQSILTQVQWNDAIDSRFLKELKAATQGGPLSVRLNTFGYNMDRTSNRFTLGTVIGVIGAYRPNEPHSFVLGRRMVPLNGERTADNINFFDCHVDENTGTVLADLGNALPLTDAFGSLKNVGPLQLAVLNNPSTKENQQVSKGADFTALGSEIPYRNQNWLVQTGGVWGCAVPKAVLAEVTNNPLALVKMVDQNNGVVAIRESAEGWFVRADNFVHRPEAGASVQTDLFAARYGQPFADATINITLVPPMPNMGGGGGALQPKAKIPKVNTPRNAVRYPKTLKTDSAGKAVLTIETDDPRNPRKYIDGQIYMFQYQFKGQAPDQQQQLDYIMFLLFDAYAVPDEPTWVDHIHPIFEQYGNLYPIMSRQLVDLGDYDSVAMHRAILELAFSLDLSDPNYMPVTRDLSAPKRQTILKWLTEKNPDGSYTLRQGGTDAPARRAPARVVATETPPAQAEQRGGKTQFYQGYQAAQQIRQKR